MTRLEPPVDAVEVESVLHGFQAGLSALGGVPAPLVTSRSRGSLGSGTDIAHSPRHRTCRNVIAEASVSIPGADTRERKEPSGRTFIGRRGTLVRLTFDACAESKVTTRNCRISQNPRGVRDAREGAQRSMICRERLERVSRRKLEQAYRSTSFAIASELGGQKASESRDSRGSCRWRSCRRQCPVCGKTAYELGACRYGWLVAVEATEWTYPSPERDCVPLQGRGLATVLVQGVGLGRAYLFDLEALRSVGRGLDISHLCV